MPPGRPLRTPSPKVTEGGTVKVPVGQFPVSKHQPQRRAWMVPGLILLVVLVAGGAVLLSHFRNPRGTLNLTLPTDIAEASVQVTGVQSGLEVVSTEATKGQARVRVPLQEELLVRVSAAGYKDWETRISLDQTDPSRDLPVKLVGASGRLLVRASAPGLKGEVDVKLLDSANKVLKSARTVQGVATFQGVPTGTQLTVKGSAPDYTARTAEVNISPPKGSESVALTLAPKHGSLQVALKGESLTRAGCQVRILDGGKELARTGSGVLDKTFAKLPLERDLMIKVSSELHQPFQQVVRLTPEDPEATLNPVLALAPPLLKITTEPKATVLVDGKKAGQADGNGRLTLDARLLKTGRQHTIKATKTDFLSSERKVTAKPNGSLALALERVYTPAIPQPDSGPGYVPPAPAYRAPEPTYRAPAPVYAPPPPPPPAAAPASGGLFLPPPTGDH